MLRPFAIACSLILSQIALYVDENRFVEPTPVAPTTRPAEADLQGVRLTVSPRKERYRPDEPVEVDIALISERDELLQMALSRRNSYRNFILLLEDFDGPVPLTRAGRRCFDSTGVDSTLLVDLRKKQPLTAWLSVSHVYDMSLDRTYTLRVKSYVPARSNPGYVVPVISEPVKIVVSWTAPATQPAAAPSK